MTATVKRERRWLKSAIATSAEAQIALPWQRGTRRKPEAMKLPETRLRARAAR
ncbi:MAG: hypothetical protein U1D35_17410 [Paracoccaceae bacterium]|nr:hypothetical protein [Paracoccaceae bacterium]